MTINFKAARDFVYANGVLWERDLFAWLFQGGSLARLHHSLKAYQNADGGYGNALEHDVRCPQSHPLALEFLLGVLGDNGVPVGKLLDGVPAWLEAQQNADGSLRNPPELLDYPHAPWWSDGGQSMPDAIVGSLMQFNAATPALRERTAQWVVRHVTPDSIRANEWLFMAYHAYDYFMHVDAVPGGTALSDYRAAAVENIVTLAQQAPPEQFYSLLRFIPAPESPVAKALPPAFLAHVLDTLQAGQQQDGGWHDQHGLPQWYPYVTMQVLRGLRRFGRQIGA